MRRSQSSNFLMVIRWSVAGLCPILALAGMLPCFAQQMHRNPFESNRTTWLKGSADVAYDEKAHAMTDQFAHEGQRSEHIQINSKQGSHIHYYYPTANAPISDELTASVWVKSNHPGIQIMAHVVLPKEADPASLEDRLTTVIRGDIYRRVGQWQQLAISRPTKLAKEQQQLMQAQLGRQINFQDAYIDRLMLNVYGGTGVTDVWIDELEIGPVFERLGAPVTKAPGSSGAPIANTPGSPSAAAKFVNFNGSALQVDGKRFFFLGVRHTDTPPKALRDAGFNTLFIDYPWDAAITKQMVDLGFWLVPTLPVASADTHFVSAEALTREVRGFPELDGVLFWNLGTALAHEQTTTVAAATQSIMTADRYHPIGADCWDGIGRYSTSVNLVSLHRWPLMTSMELTQYKDWLEARSRLANPGTFLWTWIQTHTPDWYTQVLYGKPSSAGFTEPIGPQPEQVRLLTYLAVGSGFRGIGYWSDRFLADSHQGRDRLLTVALLNQELEFLEPMLNSSISPPQWIDTSDPNVKAAVLRTQKGILVLPMWLGGSAQFVPGQAAAAKLKITVPQVPPSFQCWEVTPGEVRAIKAEHGGTGGMQITVPEFGLTTAIAFFSDNDLLRRWQELCNVRKQLAAQYTYDLAVQELEKVAKIEVQLEQAGHSLPDGAQLMQKANEYLRSSKNSFENRQFENAYREAQRALRPARILMRAQWDAAIREVETPVASPWAVSFYTLPQHWQFINQIKASSPAANQLVGGDFEVVPGRVQESWQPQECTLDDVEMKAERVGSMLCKTLDPKTGKPGAAANLTAKEGKQFLLLEIKPKSMDRLPRALERTYLAINSPAVKLPPGSIVRVSGWMAIADAIQASPDGALVYDSVGGEPLAFRLASATGGWRHFSLFRVVPASGTLNVTLALTGLGRVAFDDIRIEQMVPK